MEKTVIITEVSPIQTAKDTRKFFTIRVNGGFGQRVVSRNMWEQLRQRPDGSVSKYWERGTHAQALELMEKQIPVAGEVVTRNVVPYTIDGREVKTYTTLVFPGENIEAVFANNNHPIVDENGEIKDTRKKAILGTNPSQVFAQAEAAAKAAEVDAKDEAF